MSLTMHEASAPHFTRMLAALSKILDKAEAHCAEKKIDPAVMLGMRLFPDMFALSRQVQLSSDFAKGAMARLAGIEIPKYADEEKTFAELRERLARTIAFIESVKPAQLEGSETRVIEMKIAGNPVTFTGSDFLFTNAIPNFYFHVTTAYDILRAGGVELGKRDFMARA